MSPRLGTSQALTLALIVLLAHTVSSLMMDVINYPTVGQIRTGQARDGLPPYAAFYVMSTKLQAAMDRVSGAQYRLNWLAMLTEDVVVCFPFVGKMDEEHCLFGVPAVANATKFTNDTAAFINLQVDSFWIAETPTASDIAGVWRYTQTSVFPQSVHGSGPCSIQWSGTVTFRLNPANTSQLTTWLESPDAVRYGSTSPC
jgi:hypothetical protein